MERLLPCERCRRHVRASATTCPFCAAVTTRDASAPVAWRPAAGRLTRAALLFGSVAAATPACGAATGPAVPDAGAVSDAPERDGAPADGDAGTEEVSVVPHYGAPGL
jgi:hypothetical protein